ncbi:MAG TPA: IS3 family transposase [Solirubrobacterales bacterium]|nr:IS3 family transposase [Solirubrobacterales bacterium]
MSFQLIEAEKANYSAALMCRALELSRSGYHAWCTRGPSPRERETAKLDVEVAAVFQEKKKRYGAPRIRAELARRGLHTSRKRVARSLRNQQLAARPKRRFVHTTNSKHNEAIAPNLLQRDFSAEAPNRVWVADTTYLPALLGFIYLVVVIDLFSRKVVGWAVGDDLNAELSREAFRRAVAKRSPSPGLIFHSDRGSEFAAKRFSDALKTVGAAQSMSRSGDCWDNAPSESFFSTVEFEFEAGAAWREAADSDPELFAFIEVWYNAERLHSHNGNRSPNEAEAHWRRDALAT